MRQGVITPRASRLASEQAALVRWVDCELLDLVGALPDFGFLKLDRPLLQRLVLPLWLF
jgi:hypothetical protein